MYVLFQRWAACLCVRRPVPPHPAPHPLLLARARPTGLWHPQAAGASVEGSGARRRGGVGHRPPPLCRAPAQQRAAHICGGVRVVVRLSPPAVGATCVTACNARARAQSSSLGGAQGAGCGDLGVAGAWAGEGPAGARLCSPPAALRVRARAGPPLTLHKQLPLLLPPLATPHAHSVLHQAPRSEPAAHSRIAGMAAC